VHDVTTADQNQRSRQVIEREWLFVGAVSLSGKKGKSAEIRTISHSAEAIIG